MRALSYLVACSLVSAAAELPRGVAPSDAEKYVADSKGQFSCLSDPSIKIPFDHVNDDYCDCPDGSDEPGTSACSNGRFYCENKGHIPSWLPSRYVADGVCDYELCCDGSDEAPGLCPNKCAEVNEKYRVEKEQRLETLRKGLIARENLVVEAQKRKTEQISRADELKDSLNAKTIELDTARMQAIEIEAQDSEISAEAANPELLSKLDTSKETIKQAFALINDYDVVFSAALAKFEKLDNILKTMKEDYNPNFNDPAVKQAIRGWEDMAAQNENLGRPLNKMLPLDDILITMDDIESLASHSSTISPVSEFINWFRNVLVEYQVLPAKTNIDVVSSNLRKARERISKLEVSVEELKTTLRKQEESIAQSFGPDDILRALENVCVQSHYGEYDYEVCYFGRAQQKGNGQSTTLGKYESIEFDDNAVHMKYENGAQCWNGPIRRSDITILCGEEQKIVSVSEAEKCIYAITMISPIGCQIQQDSEDVVTNPVQYQHDEL